MEEKSCHNMDEKMKENIKKIIEDSFKDNIKNSQENRTSFIDKQLEKIYPEKKWMTISIRLSDFNGYSYHGKGALFICYYKKRLIIICSTHKNNNSIHDSKEFKEKLEEDIKSLSNEKSNLKDKLIEFEIKIKKYESIVSENESKLKKIIIEKELLQKTLKEKEEKIIYLINEIQQKKENNSFNKTFYTRDEMIALNFLSTDSKLHYAIPCLNKDLFVDVEKKLLYIAKLSVI